MVLKYTFTYCRAQDIDIKLDIYLPDSLSVSAGHNTTATGELDGPELPLIPSVVFFHGGGLTAGNREFLPVQLRDQVLESCLAFISADYRLLFPFTAKDILEDVRALFTYLSTSLNNELRSQTPTPPCLISPIKFAVAGASAGAYPARLAALYASPKPRALFSLYGSGGDFLSPFYVHQAPIPGWETSLASSKMFLAPSPADKKAILPGVSDCPMPSNATTINTPRPNIPGWEGRVFTLYVKMLISGKFLDHLMDYPGLGEKLFQAGNSIDFDRCSSPSSRTSGSIGSGGTSSSSSDLQRMRKKKMEAAIPESIRYLFPQLCITPNFPPTYLVHGTNDKAVDCRESKEMTKKLCEVGVKCEIVLAGGLGHLFDRAGQGSGVPANVLWNRYLGEVVPFLKRYLVADKQ